jgi:putative restriction endonuclease
MRQGNEGRVEMTATWRDAVWAAVRRQYAMRPGEPVTRQRLIDEELPIIGAAVGTLGATPPQTLSRVLQELRNDDLIAFLGKGRYMLLSEDASAPTEAEIRTEVERQVRARIGQAGFRRDVMERWGGRCPLTDIGDPDLLRASHIVPWRRCDPESDRTNPDNGLLLSALWDAAFDRGLVTFSDAGDAVPSPFISSVAMAALRAAGGNRIVGLSPANRDRLEWHRTSLFISDDVDA